jgi:hypothetical protein
MTATVCDIRPFIDDAFRELETTEGIHPSGYKVIRSWLLQALEQGDSSESYRLLAMAQDKIRQERAWYLESCCAAR